MLAFSMAIVAVLLFAFGMVLGVHLGDEYSKQLVTRADYWRANGIVFAIGVVASMVVWATNFLLLVAVTFGLTVGAISGLKMGFGESIGPWGFVDSKLGTNKDQVRRAKNAQHAEAVRRARKEGTPEPEVMSVEDATDGTGKNGASVGGKGSDGARSNDSKQAKGRRGSRRRSGGSR